MCSTCLPERPNASRRAWAKPRAPSSARAAATSCSDRPTPIRNRSSCRMKRTRSARRAKNVATRGTTTRRWTSTPTTRRPERRSASRPRAATMPKAVIHPTASGSSSRPCATPTTGRSPKPRKNSSKPIRAISVRFTSCAPTVWDRSGSRRSPGTTAARFSLTTARASCGGASTRKASSPTSGR